MSESTFERARDEALHYLALGLLDPAVDCLKRMLAEDPDDASAHALLSLCLNDLKRPHAALHEAQLALTIDPDEPLAHRAMGWSMISHRRLREAAHHLNHAIALNPDSAEGYLAIAELYRIQGRRAERASQIARALELAPDDTDVLVADGQLALDRGDVAHAFERASEALTLQPQAVDAIVLMGNVHLRQGNLHEAREHAVWALNENADDGGALRLMVALKARESLWLGLWWRYNTWLNERGAAGSMIVLLIAYAFYRVLVQSLNDSGGAALARMVQYAWFGLCIYTWIGPGMFRRALEKEIGRVRLAEEF